MRLLFTVCSAALTAFLPGVVLAQEFSASAGVTLTSRYVSNGMELTDGAAIQPWAELGYGGAYVGAWASNTSEAILGHDREIDLGIGYRGAVGKLAYDISYWRYYYKGPSVDCCGEYKLDLSFAATEQLTLGTAFAYDPKAEITNSKIYASIAAMENVSFDFVYGDINKGGHSYWQAGATYQFNDAFGVTLAYHDTDISKGLAVLSLDYAFGG